MSNNFLKLLHQSQLKLGKQNLSCSIIKKVKSIATKTDYILVENEHSAQKILNYVSLNTSVLWPEGDKLFELRYGCNLNSPDHLTKGIIKSEI